jgi:isoleucyl-tRNA synthetase
MFRIAEALVRWIAPILSFTADEIWPSCRASAPATCCSHTWYDGLAPLPGDAASMRRASMRLLALRDAVAKVLEPMRAAGEIGAALDAEIDLRCGDPGQLAVAAWPTSCASCSSVSTCACGAGAGRRRCEGGRIGVVAQPTSKAKCVRCWHHRADVGAHAAHPELCGRCVSNVEGPGETWQWF